MRSQRRRGKSFQRLEDDVKTSAREWEAYTYIDGRDGYTDIISLWDAYAKE